MQNTWPMSPGIPNGACFGIATSPRSVHRCAPVAPGATSSSPIPSSLQSCTAHGLRARNESAPDGSTRSPTCTLRSFPPGRSFASSTTTSIEGSAFVRRYAVASPLTPPPMTTTVGASPFAVTRRHLGLGEMVAHDLGQHVQVLGIGVRHARAREHDPGFLGDLLGLDVEIEQHLEMVGHEPCAAHQHRGRSFGGDLGDDLLHRRTPPGVGGTAGALPRDAVVGEAELGGHQIRRLLQAVSVAAAVGAVAVLAALRSVIQRAHRQRMRAEDDGGAITHLVRHRRQRLPGPAR